VAETVILYLEFGNDNVYFYNIFVKGKVVPVLLTDHHIMKAYWGSGGLAPLFDLGSRWR
jgi:hypothetical protein